MTFFKKERDPYIDIEGTNVNEGKTVENLANC